MVAETRLAAEAMRLQSSAHGVRMETEFGSDGADLPVLNVEVATNGGFQFGGNHASPPAMGERINPATPATTDLAYDPAALRWPAGNAAEARGGEAGKTAIAARSVRLAEAAGGWEDLSVT